MEQMIALERLNGTPFILNSDHIETVESTPDTVISLTNGKKVVVSNGVEDIVRKVIRFRQLCNQQSEIVKRDEAGTSRE